MRRFSLALVVIGAFLVVMGPMVKWYAYPRIAVAPANQISTTHLEAKGATVLDPGTLKEITTDLAITVRTVGDANAPKKHPGSVAYVNTTLTEDAAGTMTARDPETGEVAKRGEVERMTFDAHSGEATPGVTDDFISDAKGVETKVVHKGLVAKFPFNTEKKTYDFWDATLPAAKPIQYDGTTSIEGMKVYRFHQVLAPTRTGSMEVPLSVLGLEGDDVVDADQMYSVDRTLLVEPETGVIIQRTEKVLNTLDYQGEPRVTLTKADVQYASDTVRKNIDDYGSQATMLKLVRATGPQVALVVGLIALVGGVLLSRRKAHAPGSRVRELQDTHA